jgi:trimeric autotransporter adhesin
MKRKMLLVASAILIVSGYIQAQTPGRVPIFDQHQTGHCNSDGHNDCVDSVMTQDSSGNIGVGTTSPGAKLDVAGAVKADAVTLPPTAGAATGVLNLDGNRFLHAFGSSNTFLGTNAGNFTTVGSGRVTGIGYSALTNNTSGGDNTAVGSFALFSNTAGSSNTATGSGALYNNNGGNNTATGTNALHTNTDGVNNTATGTGTLVFNTTGNSNTATGVSALVVNTTGSENTAMGSVALDNNTTGNRNTAVGVFAGFANTTGSLNTFIGYNAGPPAIGSGGMAQLSNATAIGANAQVSASNAMVLGDGTVNVGIGVTGPFNKLDVAGDIRIGADSRGCVMDRSGTVIAGTCSSDARLKQNVQPFDPVLEQLIRLEPVHFDWKTEDYPELHLGTSRSFGLIAQEVEKVLPELVTSDERGFKAVKYSELPLLLLQAVRELKAENDGLRKQVETQKQEFQSELEAIKQLLQVDMDRSIHGR